jgi:ribonucleoside-diphosphate reductase alpha chain/ribonucleoside-triphosphate reductase
METTIESTEEIRLTEEELEGIRDFPTHMTSKGKFTYLRTYSRYLPDKGRREVFRETMERASRYSINLELKHRIANGLPVNRDIKRNMKKELRKLFMNMFSLKQGLSGRTTWVGGAENSVADKYPLSNFNCSFTITEEWNDLVELFYLLLVGTGVGFKSIPEMADKLPPIRSQFTLEHVPYNPLPKGARMENSELYHAEGVDCATIYVGDSKEGWCEALAIYLNLLTDRKYHHIKRIKVNYNSVRAKGERLKTFGGTASGHEPLMEMFTGFENVLKNQIDPHLEAPHYHWEEDGSWQGYVKVRPIHIVDMCNLIGYNVVVGGVRRTAEIALGQEDDWEFIFAKYGMNGIWGDERFEHHEYLRQRMIELGIPVPAFWESLSVKYYAINDPQTQKELFRSTSIEEAVGYALSIGMVDGRKLDPNTATQEDYAKAYYPFPFNDTRGLHHRRMSNNSIGFLRKPPKEFLDFIFEVMQMEGEPAFVNLYELSKRRLIAGGNLHPTDMEIIALAYFLGVNPCGEIDLFSKGVCNLTTINVKAFVIDGVLQYDALMEAQRLSARAGLRMTLVTLELPNWDKRQKIDRLLGCSVTGWKAAMGALGYDGGQEAELLADLRAVANTEAALYADELGVNRPLLVTTVKPEGTYTIVLNGETSGLHYAKVRRGIRRIRINKEDPLAKAVMEHKSWTVNPEVGTKGDTFEERMENARTLVIDFPEKSDAKMTELDVDVYEQFASYFRFQEYYTDHNSSNTIVLDNHEWLIASGIVYENWDNFVGVSFLAKDGGTYQLAPYENNPEAYEKLVANMEDFDMDILRKYEKNEDSEVDGADIDCSSGACGVR